MADKTTTLSFRATRELKDSLTELAKADRRPLAQYVMAVLAEHVEQATKPKPAKK